MAGIAETVYAIQECNTIFPGEVDDFFHKSAIMQRYFSHVITAERETFGSVRFPPDNVRSLAIKMGDLSRIPKAQLTDALSSDYYVVFGSSYIKGELCDFLVANRAINIHMGLSPWYRGSSCNFWALYDRRPDMVGATIHLLSAGLDSGAILFHVLPAAGTHDGFLLGMQAVKAAHTGLVQHLRDGTIHDLAPVVQDKAQEIRYTRNRDFTDEIAEDYLSNGISPARINAALSHRNADMLVRPFILDDTQSDE